MPLPNATTLRLLTLASLGLALTACGRLRGFGGDAGATTTTAASASASSTPTSPSRTTSTWAVNPRPSSAAAPRPWVDEAGRRGSCTFAGWTQKDGEKRSLFKIVLPPGHEVDGIQTWQFYYDAEGKQIHDYPSATSPRFGDDGVQDLGSTGSSIPKETATVECEITRITYKDGTVWWNENLMVSSNKRPQGGFGPSVLKEHSGEKIAVVSELDPKSMTVGLKNLGDRTTKRVRIDTICWKKDDRDYDHDWSEVAIPAGETRTVKVGINANDVVRCELLETAVSSVEWADDTEWTNRNLDSYARPR
jgi:hypothetical protein